MMLLHIRRARRIEVERVRCARSITIHNVLYYTVLCFHSADAKVSRSCEWVPIYRYGRTCTARCYCVVSLRARIKDGRRRQASGGHLLLNANPKKHQLRARLALSCTFSFVRQVLLAMRCIDGARRCLRWLVHEWARNMLARGKCELGMPFSSRSSSSAAAAKRARRSESGQVPHRIDIQHPYLSVE